MRNRIKKSLEWLGIFSGVWAIIRWVWGVIAHIGNFQTLWGLVKDWPTYLKYAALVVGSQWFPLVLAVLCLLAWGVLKRYEKKKNRELKEPIGGFGRLAVSFDGSSQDCMWPVTFRTQDGHTWKGIMVRLRVNSETESNISGCKAAITSLEKNGGVVVSGVQLPLLFTPAQNSGSDTKTIKYGQPEYLEVLWITDLGEAEIKTDFPFAFAQHQKLDRPFAYSMHINFSATNIITKTVVVVVECKSGAWVLSIKRGESDKREMMEPAQPSRGHERLMGAAHDFNEESEASSEKINEVLDRVGDLIKERKNRKPSTWSIRQNMLGLLIEAGAYRLNSEKNLVVICDRLVAAGNEHPFKHFEREHSPVVSGEWLEFLKAYHLSGGEADESSAWSFAVAKWRGKNRWINRPKPVGPQPQMVPPPTGAPKKGPYDEEIRS